MTRSTGPGAETNADGRPFEDQFVRAERQARQLVEDADRIEAANRADRDRKAAYRDRRPRVQAIHAMGKETVGFRGHPTLGARQKSLRAHPTYQALPADQRGEWDAMVADAHEAIEYQGDAGTTWRAIEALADRQADELPSWDPPAEDPAVLAADLAAIPRG
jgi:hypothetical protein